MPRTASAPEFGQFRRGILASGDVAEDLRVSRPLRWVVGYVVGIYPAANHCLVIDRDGQSVTLLHHYPYYRPEDWPEKAPQQAPADPPGNAMPADPPVDF